MTLESNWDGWLEWHEARLTRGMLVEIVTDAVQYGYVVRKSAMPGHMLVLVPEAGLNGDAAEIEVRSCDLRLVRAPTGGAL